MDNVINPAAPAQPQVARRPDVADAARKFEAVLLGQVFQMMLSTVPEDGPFGGGHAESIYKGMLAEKMGEEMSKRGGVGLTPKVFDELMRLGQGEGR